ncbi:ankyrin repeat ph and sec7 domain containing protein secg-related [Holotrichia oblita]|uniref:Ankyrin repeat ph and sec7 domain containing protein secg-related n=1 Tax=Holotrichia oblita TaxID=644536 RepID=A0ACB9SJG3_HOLOL|nr:ankyrin repeat ph and sec7 domain containing protein secg-related [Holotrichia oblita]
MDPINQPKPKDYCLYQFAITTSIAAKLFSNDNVKDFVIFVDQESAGIFGDIIVRVQGNEKSNWNSSFIHLKYETREEREKSDSDKWRQIRPDLKDWYDRRKIFHLNKNSECQCVTSEIDVLFFLFSNRSTEEPEFFSKTTCDYDNTIREFLPLDGPWYKPNSENRIRQEEVFDHKFFTLLNQFNLKSAYHDVETICQIANPPVLIDCIIDYFMNNDRRERGLWKRDFQMQLEQSQILNVLENYILPLAPVAELVDDERAIIWNEIALHHDITIVSNNIGIERCIYGCWARKIKQLLNISWNTYLTWNNCFSDEVNKRVEEHLKQKKKINTDSRYYSAKCIKFPNTLKSLIIELWKCKDLPLLLKTNMELSYFEKYQHLEKSYVLIEDLSRKFDELTPSKLKIWYNMDYINNNESKNIHEHVKLRDSMLEKTLISLQGRRPICLKDFTNDSSELRKLFTCTDILELMKKRTAYLREDFIYGSDYLAFIVEDEEKVSVDCLESNASGSNIIAYCPSSQIDDYINTLKNNSRYRKYSRYRLCRRNDLLELVEGDESILRNYFIDQHGNPLYNWKNENPIPIIGEMIMLEKRNYVLRDMSRPIISKTYFSVDEKQICLLSGELHTLDKNLEVMELDAIPDKEHLPEKKTYFLTAEADKIQAYWNEFSEWGCPLLNINVKNGKLELMKSSLCNNNLSSHILYDGKQISQEEMIGEISNKTSGITVLVGEPGVGKSSLLRWMSNTSTTHNYVIFVDLANLVTHLKEYKFSKVNMDNYDFIDFVFKKLKTNLSDKFSSLAFTLYRHKRVILLLDSFDDIAESWGEQILQSIKFTKYGDLHIIIATRFNCSNLLMKQQNVEIVKLERFNQCNRQYLTQWNLTQRLLDSVSSEFITNPLYLNFLRTLADTEEEVTMNKFHLYQKFIDLKIKYSMEQIYRYFISYDVNEAISIFQKLALVEVLGKQYVEQKLGWHYDDGIRDILKFGIVLDFNEERMPIFYSDAFINSLCAQWMLRMKKNKALNSSAKDVYKTMLDRGKLDVLHILHENSKQELHRAVIESDLSKVEHICKQSSKLLHVNDELGRSALHIAAICWCQSRGSDDSLQILNIIMKTMREKYDGVNKLDDIMNWSWTDYLHNSIHPHLDINVKPQLNRWSVASTDDIMDDTSEDITGRYESRSDDLIIPLKEIKMVASESEEMVRDDFPMTDPDMKLRLESERADYRYQCTIATYVAIKLSTNSEVEDYTICIDEESAGIFGDITVKVKLKGNDKYYLSLIGINYKDVTELDFANYREAFEKIGSNKELKCKRDILDEDILYCLVSHQRVEDVVFSCGASTVDVSYYSETDKIRNLLLPCDDNSYKFYLKSQDEDKNFEDKFYILLNQPNYSKIYEATKQMREVATPWGITKHVADYFWTNCERDVGLSKLNFEYLLQNVSSYSEIVLIAMTDLICDDEWCQTWNKIILGNDITVMDNNDVVSMNRCIYGCWARIINNLLACNIDWDKYVNEHNNFSAEIIQNIEKYFDQRKSVDPNPELFQCPTTLKSLIRELWKCGDLPLLLNTNLDFINFEEYKKDVKRSSIVIDDLPFRRKVYSSTLKICININDIEDRELRDNMLLKTLISVQGRKPTNLKVLIGDNVQLRKSFTCTDILDLMKKRTAYVREDSLKGSDYLVFIIEDYSHEGTIRLVQDPLNGGNIRIYCHPSQLKESIEILKAKTEYTKHEMYHLFRFHNRLQLIEGDKSKLRSCFIDESGNPVYNIEGEYPIPIAGPIIKLEKRNHIQKYLRRPTISKSYFNLEGKRICLLSGELDTLDQNIEVIESHMAKADEYFTVGNFKENLPAKYKNFISALNKNEKVVLVLDSFDEVDKFWNQRVFRLIELFKHRGVQVVIATRINYTDILMKQDNVQIYKLERLNPNDKQYLTEWKLAQNDLDSIPTELRTNPLYLNFLRELILNPENIKLTSRFSLYEKLLEMMVKHNFKRIQRRFNSYDVDEVLSLLQKLALVVVLGKRYIEDLLSWSYNDDTSNFGSIVANVDKDGNPEFYHHSFINFLCAQWLLTSMKDEKLKNFAKYVYKRMLDRRELQVLDILYDDLELHQAVIETNISKVDEICEKHPNRLEECDQLGRAAVHVAAIRCRYSDGSRDSLLILDRILRCMQEKSYDTKRVDKIMNWNWTHYIYDDIHSDLSKNVNSKLSLLHVVSYYGNFDAVDVLIKQEGPTKHDINLVDDYDYTPLDYAILRNTSKFLSEETEYHFRHMIVTTDTSKNLIELLLDNGAKTTRKTVDSEYDVSLCLAIKERNVDVLEALLKVKYVDVNRYDKNKETPIYIATKVEHLPSIMLLMQFGANVNLKSGDGKIPLDVAVELGRQDIVELLSENSTATSLEDTRDNATQTATEMSRSPPPLPSPPIHSRHRSRLDSSSEAHSIPDSGYQSSGDDDIDLSDADSNIPLQEIPLKYIGSSKSEESGFRYQFAVTAVVAALLSADDNVEDYVIYVDVESAGRFDDLVVRIKLRDSDELYLYLLQIKYKMKKALVIRRISDFFDSYTKIVADPNLFFRRGIPNRNIRFGLFSNAVPMRLNLTKCVDLDRISKILLPVDNASYKFIYKGSDSAEYRFFHDFYLHLNQPHFQGILRIIESITCAYAYPVISYITSYFKDQDLRSKGLNKHIFDIELQNIRLYNTIAPLIFTGHTSNHNTDIWHQITLEQDVTIINGSDDRLIHSYLNNFLIQGVNRVLNIDITSLTDDLASDVVKKFCEYSRRQRFRYWITLPDTFLSLIVELWKYGALPLIIKTDHDLSFFEKYRNLRRSYILIDYPEEQIQHISPSQLKIFTNLGNIENAELRDKLLDTIAVSLQGRKPITLKTLVGNDKDLMVRLTCADIIELMQNRMSKLNEEDLICTNFSLFLIEDEEYEMEDNFRKLSTGSDRIEIFCHPKAVADCIKIITENPKYQSYPFYRLRRGDGTLKLLQGDESRFKTYFIDECGDPTHQVMDDMFLPIIGQVILPDKHDDIPIKCVRKAIISESSLRSEEGQIYLVSGTDFTEYESVEFTEIDPHNAGIDLSVENSFIKVEEENRERYWNALILLKQPIFEVVARDGRLELLRCMHCPDLNSHIEFGGEKMLEEELLRELKKDSNTITVIIGDLRLKGSPLKSLCNSDDSLNYILFSNMKEVESCILKDKNILLDPVQFIFNDFNKRSRKYNSFLCGLREKKRLMIVLDSYDESISVCKEETLRFIGNILQSGIQVIIGSKLEHCQVLMERFSVKIFKTDILTEETIATNPFELSEEISRTLIDSFLRNITKLNSTEMKSFLKRLKDINIQDEDGNTLLHHAITNKDIRLFYLLLQHGANTEVPNRFGETPLHVVIQYKEEEAFKVLLRKDSNVNIQDVYQKTPLHYTVEYKNIHFVRLLLQKGANTNLGCRLGKSALHYAVEENNLFILEALLENGARVNLEDHDHETALHYAVKNNNMNFVLILLDAGAKINSQNKYKQTSLHLAIKYNCADIFILLLNKDGNIKLEDEDNKTPLHYAAEQQDTIFTFRLLEMNPDIDAKDFSRKTPLHCAIKRDIATFFARKNISDQHYKREEKVVGMTQFFLEKKADVDVQDRDRKTPLHYASEAKANYLVERLLGEGAKVNLPDIHGKTPLHYAAKQGCNYIAQCLLDNNAEVNIQDENGKTPLHNSVQTNNKFILRLLLKNNANVNLQDRYGKTPLHYAAKENYGYISEYLLQNKAVTKVKDQHCKTPLHYAAESNGIYIVQRLLARKAEVNVGDDQMKTPLHYAAKGNCDKIVQLLLKADANINLQDIQDKTPLHLAVEAGEPQKITEHPKLKSSARSSLPEVIPEPNVEYLIRNVISFLRESRANINFRDTRCRTLLHYAAEGNLENIVPCLNSLREKYKISDDYPTTTSDKEAYSSKRAVTTDLVQFLLERGANANLPDEDLKTPLHYAVKTDNINIIKLLLYAGANRNLRDKHLRTPLHYAVMEHTKDVIPLLLDSTATINLQDEDLKTPLHYAMEEGCDDIVQLLVERGADVNLQDEFCKTPFDYAKKAENLRIFSFREPYLYTIISLLENGADPNIRDAQMKTPLQYSVESENAEVVKILLENYADVNFSSNKKKTPLHYAAERNNLEILSLLLEKGANVNFEDADKNTPLHYAAANGHADLIKLLLEKDALIDVENKRGITPLEYAIECEDRDLLKPFLDSKHKEIVEQYMWENNSVKSELL